MKVEQGIDDPKTKLLETSLDKDRQPTDLSDKALSTTLYLVRHGETDWNVQGRLQGHVEVPLNEKGRLQARSIACWLADKNINVLYSSDLIRARETAETIGLRIGKTPILDQRLREVNTGTWSGCYTRDLMEAQTTAWRTWRNGGDAPQGAETYWNLQRRSMAAIKHAIELFPGQAVIFVTHVGVIRAVIGHVTDMRIGELDVSLTVPTASTTIIEHNPVEGYVVHEIADTSYLRSSVNAALPVRDRQEAF